MRKEGVTVEDYANALLSHQSAAPYPVLWVPSQRNEPAAIVSEDQVEYDKSSPFYWACDAHQKLQAEIKELEKHPEAEGLLWQLFQKQKGWLALCENGQLDLSALKNSKKLATAPDYNMTGASFMDAPIISMNSVRYAGMEDMHTLLIHELAHNACNFIDINFAETNLFTTCLKIEQTKGTNIILNGGRKRNANTGETTWVSGIYKDVTRSGRYDSDEINSELFARLLEERIKDPKEFAKQLPLLDCFYKEFVFPTIRAAVAQNGKTLEHFQESMDSIPLRNGKNLETGKRLLDILVDINDGDKKKQSLRDKAEHLKRILDKEPCRYSNTPEGKPSFSKWKTASDELKNHETACQAYLEKSESFVSNLMKYIHRKSKYVEMKDEQDFKLLLLSKTLEPPSPKDEPAYEEYKEKCEKRAHRPDLKKKAWSRRDYKDLMLPQKPETTR